VSVGLEGPVGLRGWGLGGPAERTHSAPPRHLTMHPLLSLQAAGLRGWRQRGAVQAARGGGQA
jgi:hypothetical protein